MAYHRKVNPETIGVIIERYLATEALSDMEIAQRLGIGTTTVNLYRRQCEIPVSDKFARKFDVKYGPQALERFTAMVQAHMPLAQIARTFGFTREYARQVRAQLRKRGTCV
jgi:hypothetical protein